MTNSTKIFFHLRPDDDGYPPVAVESAWATPDSQHGVYVIDNIPFFTSEATLGDSIIAREEDGALWFVSLIGHSGNSLIRAVFFDETQVDRVSQRLTNLGCSVEYARSYKLLAISVPAQTDLSAIQAILHEESISGNLDYEEPLLRQ